MSAIAPLAPATMIERALLAAASAVQQYVSRRRRRRSPIGRMERHFDVDFSAQQRTAVTAHTLGLRPHP